MRRTSNSIKRQGKKREQLVDSRSAADHLSLHPLRFEEAVRAAMATGKPPADMAPKRPSRRKR
jgi:hypothetical protein